MVHRGVKISCRENRNLEVVTRSGQVLKASTMDIADCMVGLDILDNFLAIGVGGGSVKIGSMTTGQQPPLPQPFTTFIPQQRKFSAKEVGRNETCPCNSGKKYKKCCGSVC